MSKATGRKTKKRGRFSRRMTRIERRTIRVMMLPVIVIAQRRMARSLERV